MSREIRSFSWTDDDNNAGGTAHFAIDAQSRSDYGYNGIAKTSEVSKQIIQHYYGSAPQFSYLWGCSNGGRDAIVAAHASRICSTVLWRAIRALTCLAPPSLKRGTSSNSRRSQPPPT